MDYVSTYLNEVSAIARALDPLQINRLAQELAELRDRGGRLFFLGVGGSAANCSHAVNDFRKLCGIEAYAPVDNVSELTARTNDEGWETVFASWLLISRAKKEDALFILSVGGGDLGKQVSPNIVSALKYAKHLGMKIFGIVGRDGGYTKQVGDIVLVIPPLYGDRITPHSEEFQAVLWHCLVSHPQLQVQVAKWESLVK